MDNKIRYDFFDNDRFFGLTGVQILSVSEDSAQVELKVQPHHLNASGVLHGGMLFTLADAAFGVLAENLHSPTVTQSAQINYIAPGDSDYYVATSVELVRNGRNFIHQVIIKDKNDRIVCTATLNGFIKGELKNAGK